MPTETPAPTRQKTRNPSVDPLPPDLEPLAPKTVVDASRELAGVRDRAAETAAAARAAREAVQGAQAADEAAAIEAAAAGKKPPAPTLPDAEKRAHEVGREAAACVELERRAAGVYLDAAQAALEPFAAAADAEIQKLAGTAADHLAAVEAALVRGRELRHLRKALRPEGFHGREPEFRPALIRRRGHTSKLPATVEGLLAQLRAALGEAG